MKAPAPSRLLARLDASLAKARRPVDVACLRAERAGYLARLGHFDEARAVISSVHAQFDPHSHAAVSAWLCLAEGWMLHFGSLSGGARDRIKRAEALSGAAGLTQLQALSSAWLAHLDYCDDQVEDMIRHLLLAFKLAAPDNHGARARASLVVGLAYHYVRRLDRAQPWYARAREHATTDGDETTLSALNFNLTSMRAHHAAEAAVFGGADAQEEARHAMASSQSTGNFDQWIGTQALDALVPMQRAALASVQGQYGEALSLYERHFDDVQKQGLARLNGVHLADMAWCRWHLGDSSGSQRDAQACAASLGPGMHVDDLAMSHARLGMVFKLLGNEEAAVHHASRGRELWNQHQQLRRKLLQQLEEAQLRPH